MLEHYTNLIYELISFGISSGWWNCTCFIKLEFKVYAKAQMVVQQGKWYSSLHELLTGLLILELFNEKMMMMMISIWSENFIFDIFGKSWDFVGRSLKTVPTFFIFFIGFSSYLLSSSLFLFFSFICSKACIQWLNVLDLFSSFVGMLCFELCWLLLKESLDVWFIVIKALVAEY